MVPTGGLLDDEAAQMLPARRLRWPVALVLVLWALHAQRRLPLLAVPRDLRVQPIDTRAVAHHLVTLAESAPAGRLADLGGPGVLTVRELAEAYLTATGRRRLVAPVPIPGSVGRAFRAGSSLCEQQATDGRTFAEFLAPTPS